MAPDKLALVPGLGFDGKRSGLNVVLVVLAVVLAVASVGYAVSVSGDQDHTEFYLLAENESGELTATDYPTTFTSGQPNPVFVGIGNHEGGRTQYTVVVKLQRTFVENDTVQVLEEQQLQQVRMSVPPDRRRVRQVNVTPTMRGADMRLVFLLYQEGPPSQPSMQNADRETHLWLNVTVGGSTESDASGVTSNTGTTTTTTQTDTTTDSANTRTTTAATQTETTTDSARTETTADLPRSETTLTTSQSETGPNTTSTDTAAAPFVGGFAN